MCQNRSLQGENCLTEIVTSETHSVFLTVRDIFSFVVLVASFSHLKHAAYLIEHWVPPLLW